ncbi:polysaccharide pyruvyl transferase family protein [Methylopila henanensis]|uniref:Polysaccharide pyruvyl transferase family protein n=1 Tax=Methylopila henanensis TaxID=873516 RepID=A0ABW4K495_9HYPH
MKVMLCNDTATKAHVGCRAVSDAHARMLGRLGHAVTARFFVNEIRIDGVDRFEDLVAAMERNERFMAALEEVEAVVVNGEGTIHHGSGLALVAALHVAKRRGKATLLVNCLLEEVPLEPALLDAFDRLSVRETRSAAYMATLGVRCVQTFDSVVAARFAGEGSDLAGKTVVTDWTAKNDPGAGAASMRLMRSDDLGPSVALFQVHGERGGLDVWPGAVATLAAARAVASSRHHGLYLAGLARTPFVALRGRTWKGEGLLETLGGDLPMVDGYDALRDALARVGERRAAYEAAFDRLAEARDLQHFDILGRGDDSDEAAEVARLRRDVEARPDLAEADARNVAKRRAQEAAWTGAKPKKRSFLRRLFG